MENDQSNIDDKGTTFVVDASTSDSPTPLMTCPDGQEISPPTPTPPFLDSAPGTSGTKNVTFPSLKYHQKPRKKRTKLVNIAEHGVKSGGNISKPKCARKPDPNAPKITRPCTECGKKFWSWKALFGHMRCHPEREWRGINPPPNFSRHHHNDALTSGTKENSYWMSEEDHEVAVYLLMLANGRGPDAAAAAAHESPTVTTACNNVAVQGTSESDNAAALMGCGDVDENTAAAGPSSGLLNCTKFECSSCKKVFGSHQALGGHRASHKNVKGCFAITKNDGEEEDRTGEGEVVKDGTVEEDKMLMVFGHKCTICLRVFSSGQALGGHKRCHWEKGDEPSGFTQDLNPFSSGKEGSSGLDLNLPAPAEDDDSSSSYYSGLALDLRLGLKP
nr:zinc finger protein ZAT3-like [Coffea arabica]